MWNSKMADIKIYNFHCLFSANAHNCVQKGWRMRLMFDWIWKLFQNFGENVSIYNCCEVLINWGHAFTRNCSFASNFASLKPMIFRKILDNVVILAKRVDTIDRGLTSKCFADHKVLKRQLTRQLSRTFRKKQFCCWYNQSLRSCISAPTWGEFSKLVLLL